MFSRTEWFTAMKNDSIYFHNIEDAQRGITTWFKHNLHVRVYVSFLFSFPTDVGWNLLFISSSLLFISFFLFFNLSLYVIPSIFFINYDADGVVLQFFKCWPKLLKKYLWCIHPWYECLYGSGKIQLTSLVSQELLEILWELVFVHVLFMRLDSETGTLTSNFHLQSSSR